MDTCIYSCTCDNIIDKNQNIYGKNTKKIIRILNNKINKYNN